MVFLLLKKGSMSKVLQIQTKFKNNLKTNNKCCEGGEGKLLLIEECNQILGETSKPTPHWVSPRVLGCFGSTEEKHLY